jgi:hypothetical protein
MRDGEVLEASPATIVGHVAAILAGVTTYRLKHHRPFRSEGISDWLQYENAEGTMPPADYGLSHGLVPRALARLPA